MPIVATAIAARFLSFQCMITAAMNINSRPGTSRIPASHSTCEPLSPRTLTKKLVLAAELSPVPKLIKKIAVARAMRLGLQIESAGITRFARFSMLISVT